jgi:hypothetical protein
MQRMSWRSFVAAQSDPMCAKRKGAVFLQGPREGAPLRKKVQRKAPCYCSTGRRQITSGSAELARGHLWTAFWFEHARTAVRAADGVCGRINKARAELGGWGAGLRRFRMGRHVFVLTTSAFVLTCGILAASAQQVPDVPTVQQQPQNRQEQAAQSTTLPSQSTTTKIQLVRVKAMDPAAPKLRFQLSDGSVDLMKAFSLGGLEGVGGAWKMPPTGETFDARYGRWEDHRPD